MSRCILCRAEVLDEPGVCERCATRRRLRRFRIVTGSVKRNKRRFRKTWLLRRRTVLA